MDLKIFIFVLILSTIYLDQTSATVLTARDSRISHGQFDQTDSILVNPSQKVVVPSHFDISSRYQPTPTAAFTVSVDFVRGCSGIVDLTTGQTSFPTLHCRYSRNQFLGCFRGSSNIADPHFVVGSQVYFVSEVDLSVELTTGITVAITLDTEDFITTREYCDGLNDQEQAVDAVASSFLSRDYSGLPVLFAPDVTFGTNAFATIYTGIASVIAYFQLGDPSISDTFLCMNSTRVTMASSGNIVHASYYLVTKSLQLPEGSNVYEDTQVHTVYFDEYNRITSARLSFNTALVFTYFPQTNAPNISHICGIIQDHCTGSLQQYADYDSCVSFMESIPLLKTQFAQSIGVNDAACRAFHTVLAQANPSEHCIHTSPYNAAMTMGAAGIGVTPCIDETGPFNPLPSAPAARNVDERDNGDSDVMWACDSTPLCQFSVFSQQPKTLYGAIALESAMMHNIPFAGQIIADCVSSGRCTQE